MSWVAHPTFRWAAGGWTFFIAENALLSENRTWIIAEIGDNNYHLAYGTLSTIATASIGYAYYSIRKTTLDSSLRLWKTRPPVPHAFGAWVLSSIGLVMASQVGPKMQIPFALVESSPDSSVGPAPPNTQRQLQVRCPFDFTGKRDSSSLEVYGLERVTRHPGLWSMGFFGLSQALTAKSLPSRVWWIGPAAVAWLGGTHTDSRFRRGMGGTLEPSWESQTSNIPFGAMLLGKQGNGCWQALVGEELKPLNAAIAIGMSSLWILRKLR